MAVTETFKFDMSGADAIVQKMRSIPVELRDKAGRAALRKAANIIKIKVRDNSQWLDDPKTPEAIYKNVVVQYSARRFRQTGDLMMRVGILGGAKQYVDSKKNRRSGQAGKSYAVGGSASNPGGDTWYWRFLEFGTQKMAARPFMRPAMDSSGDEVLEVFITEMTKAADSILK